MTDRYRDYRETNGRISDKGYRDRHERKRRRQRKELWGGHADTKDDTNAFTGDTGEPFSESGRPKWLKGLEDGGE